MLVNHWRYYLVALLLTLVYLWGVERQRQLSALPETVRLTPADYPVAVGSAIAADREQLEFLVQSYPIGQRIELVGQRQTVSAVLTNAITPLVFTILLINGSLFWLVSVSVFAPRSDRVPARDLFWGTILYGLAVMIGDVYMPLGAMGPSVVLPLLRIVTVTLLPILFLNVSLTFPQRRVLLDRAPALMPGVTILGLAVVIWMSVAILRYFHSPTPQRFDAITVPEIVHKLFLVTVFSIGCLSFLKTTRQARRARERQQARWILWGITIGAAPFVFLYTLPKILGGQPWLPLEATRIFSLVIPAAFSFTVIWYKFLDIDLIIRRSLMYPLLAGVMVGIYFLLGVQIGHRVERAWPVVAPAIPMLATLIAVLLFLPTRRALGSWVDRTFFRLRYRYDRVLEEFKQEILGASSQQQLAQTLATFLRDTLDTKKAVVVVRARDQTWMSGSQQSWIRESAFDAFGNLLMRHQAVAVPGSVSTPELECPDFPALFERVGFRVAQVIGVDAFTGIAIVGEKKVERLFIDTDLRLLSAVAEVTAAALERMNLVQDFIHEAAVRSRYEEMSRFKTEFLARVAHDLRSPLTSISWSARNLLDGITGTLEPNQREYLNGIEASSNQMVRLVNNLMEMSRLEEAEVKLAEECVDLEDIVRTSIRKLEASSREKKVALDLQIGASSTVVRGDSAALLEVVDNLLENAIRYAPAMSRVEVGIAPGKDSTVVLSVRDHGPGVPADERERIFEKYRQGSPSPHSNQHGFGLGLHVVRTYAELMNGNVSVTNHEDGGALFTCVLRTWREDEGS